MKRLSFFLPVIALSAFQPMRRSAIVSQSNSCPTSEQRLSDFDNHNKPLIPTLLLIARIYNAPIGIEKVTSQALHQPIRVELHKATLGELLDAAAGSLPDYAWRIDDGVVNVYGATERADKSNLFNLRLDYFEVENGSINDANARLKQTIWSGPPLSSESGVRGVAGDSPGVGALEGRKLTLVMRKVTLREILNRLVRLSGDVAWVSRVPPDGLAHAPQSGLWQLVPLSAPDACLP